MDAFKLDRRIVIEQRTDTRNALGEGVPAWTTFATVWAQRVPMRGAELFAAQQVVPQVENKLRIRWRDDLDESMRIVDDGVTYGIQHIAEIGRRDGLEIKVRRPE